jgi:hypothetical protein
MAAHSQLEFGRLRCGRSVGAEDVSGAGGLRTGQACIGGRTLISPAVWRELASSRTLLLVAAQGPKSIENVVPVPVLGSGLSVEWRSGRFACAYWYCAAPSSWAYFG